MALNKDECQVKIISEFHKWKDREHPDTLTLKAIDALIFYSFLQKKLPELLSFRCNGDRWQVVKGWLAREQLIDDT